MVKSFEGASDHMQGRYIQFFLRFQFPCRPLLLFLLPEWGSFKTEWSGSVCRKYGQILYWLVPQSILMQPVPPLFRPLPQGTCSLSPWNCLFKKIVFSPKIWISDVLSTLFLSFLSCSLFLMQCDGCAYGAYDAEVDNIAKQPTTSLWWNSSCDSCADPEDG